MLEPPQIVDTAAVQVACIPITVAREQIREVMQPGLGEVLAAIAEQGLEPAGPWFTHHLRMNPSVFDFRICVPVATRIRRAGRVLAGTLPAAKVVRTVYHGPYEDLGAAWVEFHEWIAAAGHSTRTDLWERYVTGPESDADPAQWRTELNRPLAGGT